MSKSSGFYQGEPDMKIVKEGDSDGDVYLGHPVLAVVRRKAGIAGVSVRS